MSEWMLSGGILAPDDLAYQAARENYNRRFDKCPCIINFCYTTQDVIHAIRYVKEKEVAFRIRSGRHDYEANSNLDCGMVIDISPMNYVLIEECRQIAKIGGGITSGDMYFELAVKGYTLPSGECSDVGFGSLTSVGGVGFASRYLGLACDNLLEVELVNWEGCLIVANEHCHKDLFWALRGGLSGNFGVVVSMTYKLTPVRCAAIYEVSWDPIYTLPVLSYWESFGPCTDRRLSSGISLECDACGQLSLSSSGEFFGSKEELSCLLQGLLAIAPVESLVIEELPYEQVVKVLGDSCIGPNKFKGTGTFIFAPIGKCGVDRLLESLEQSPPGARHIFEFIGLNGAVADVGPTETAYVHRQALYLLEVKTIWTEDRQERANIRWTNRTKALMDTMGCGTYRGFTNFALEDWQQQYYGINYARLQQVKRQYDPFNLFCFPQSIEP